MQPEPPAKESQPNSNTPAKSAAQPPDAPRMIDAAELFSGQREVWIHHGDQRYRLRITAAGKLILTK